MQKDYQQEILTRLLEGNIPDTLVLAEQMGIAHLELDGILKGLLVTGYVVLTNKKVQQWRLTEQGKKFQLSSPQYTLINSIGQQGNQRQSLQSSLGQIFSLGFPICMKKKWIKLEGKKIMRSVGEVQDELVSQLRLIKSGESSKLKEQVLKDLKSRKMAQLKVTNFYQVSKGQKYRSKKVQEVPDLTSQMILDGSWNNLNFKAFNLEAAGLEVQPSTLHPLMRVRQQFRTILLQMGFQEMKTDQYVESSFWNFDSLFQPQKHPARDAHDTFFLRDPELCKIDDAEYWQKVKKMHQKGGFGSLGYQYEWSQNQAKKNILRTHTTAVSSRVLYRIAQQKDFTPKKYFSIDRVFRNQAIDKTHLAEFHQVQGFILDRNLGMGHLIGLITQFFTKIGIKKLWFKPAYNPYTQPSMQIFGYHPLLKKKIELGNSGIFRPEMLKPMGFPDDMQVIAWGLSLQRPTMIQYNISNITQLFGHTMKLSWLRKTPVVCFHN